MEHTEGEEGTKTVVEVRLVSTVQLSNGSEDERERDIFREVDMGAARDGQGIELFLAVDRSLAALVADEVLLAQALGDDAAGEEEGIEREWRGPGAGDCCKGLDYNDMEALGTALTEHLGEWQPKAKVGSGRHSL